MTRPKYCRKIECEPGARHFRPEVSHVTELEEIILTLDEFEALRLADFEGFYQEESALKMNISRQTFGRIIDSARKKTADALVNGKAIIIEGGIVSLEENGIIKCSRCDNSSFCCKNRKDEYSCPRCRKISKKDNKGE